MSATILLVEDDEHDAFFLKRALSGAGILNPIQHVWDGREALEYFQGGGRFGDRSRFPLPGLVLLDLKLPCVMGLDVLKWIRGEDQFRSILVLVLSASQFPDDIVTARRNGADAYLVKPSDLDQLDAVARTIRDAWLNTNHPSPSISVRTSSLVAAKV